MICTCGPLAQEWFVVAAILVSKDRVCGAARMCFGRSQKSLDHEFGISHSTIQVEVEGCEPNDMYCIIKVGRSGAGRSPILGKREYSSSTSLGLRERNEIRGY